MAAMTALPSSTSPALKFEVLAQCGRARLSRMTLPHYVAETPMFMPVGTQGAPPPPTGARAGNEEYVLAGQRRSCPDHVHTAGSLLSCIGHRTGRVHHMRVSHLPLCLQAQSRG